MSISQGLSANHSLPETDRNRANLDTLLPQKVEMTLLILSLISGLICWTYDESLAEIGNIVVPGMLATSLFTGAFLIIRANPKAILTPLIWNRVTVGVYFCVGTIIPEYVNAITKNQIDSFYNTYEVDIAKFNVVIALFMIIYSIFSKFLILFAHSKTQNIFNLDKSHMPAKDFGWLVFYAGLITQLFYVIPSEVGIYTNVRILFLGELAQATFVGCLLILTNSPSIKEKYIIYGYVFFNFIVGILLFNKSISLFGVVVILISNIFNRSNLKSILISAFLLLSILNALQPIVHFGRNATTDNEGFIYAIPISERVNIVTQYFTQGESVDYQEEVQSGWARLSYLNGATFAINAYDSGQPGSSLGPLAFIWIPRFLWKDKPSVTQGGIDFNVAVTGRDTSQSSPGIPADGYWNAGWLGVVMAALLLSFVSTLWSIYSLTVIQSQSWHLFFIVMLGIRYGIRADGMIAPDIGGPVVFAIIGHIALQFLNRLLKERKPLSRVRFYN
jgi:type III secretory pathway component EscS